MWGPTGGTRVCMSKKNIPNGQYCLQDQHISCASGFCQSLENSVKFAGLGICTAKGTKGSGCDYEKYKNIDCANGYSCNGKAPNQSCTFNNNNLGASEGEKCIPQTADHGCNTKKGLFCDITTYTCRGSLKTEDRCTDSLQCSGGDVCRKSAYRC